MPTPATASSSADSALLVTLAPGYSHLLAPASRGVEAFDVTEVAEWLTRTSHGNNPEAMADAAAAAVKYKYPPDKQPAAIKLVMDQMESMAPRYADERRSA